MKSNAGVFPTDEPDVSVDGSLHEGSGQMVRIAMGNNHIMGWILVKFVSGYGISQILTKF